MQVRLLVNRLCDGLMRRPGEVLEVSETEGLSLIASFQAEHVGIETASLRQTERGAPRIRANMSRPAQ